MSYSTTRDRIYQYAKYQTDQLYEINLGINLLNVLRNGHIRLFIELLYAIPNPYQSSGDRYLPKWLTTKLKAKAEQNILLENYAKHAENPITTIENVDHVTASVPFEKDNICEDDENSSTGSDQQIYSTTSSMYEDATLFNDEQVYYCVMDLLDKVVQCDSSYLTTTDLNYCNEQQNIKESQTEYLNTGQMLEIASSYQESSLNAQNIDDINIYNNQSLNQQNLFSILSNGNMNVYNKVPPTVNMINNAFELVTDFIPPLKGLHTLPCTQLWPVCQMRNDMDTFLRAPRLRLPSHLTAKGRTFLQCSSSLVTIPISFQQFSSTWCDLCPQQIIPNAPHYSQNSKPQRVFGQIFGQRIKYTSFSDLWIKHMLDTKLRAFTADVNKVPCDNIPQFEEPKTTLENVKLNLNPHNRFFSKRTELMQNLVPVHYPNRDSINSSLVPKSNTHISKFINNVNDIIISNYKSSHYPNVISPFLTPPAESIIHVKNREYNSLKFFSEPAQHCLKPPPNLKLQPLNGLTSMANAAIHTPNYGQIISYRYDEDKKCSIPFNNMLDVKRNLSTISLPSINIMPTNEKVKKLDVVTIEYKDDDDRIIRDSIVSKPSSTSTLLKPPKRQIKRKISSVLNRRSRKRKLTPNLESNDNSITSPLPLLSSNNNELVITNNIMVFTHHWKSRSKFFLQRLSIIPENDIFLQLNVDHIPGYVDCIRFPLSYKHILTFINMDKIRNDLELVYHIYVMHANAIMFNSSDHEIYQIALRVWEKVRVCLLEYLQSIICP